MTSCRSASIGEANAFNENAGMFLWASVLAAAITNQPGRSLEMFENARVRNDVVKIGRRHCE